MPRQHPIPPLPTEEPETVEGQVLDDIPAADLGFAEPEEEPAPVRALTVPEYSADHVITGLGMLAKMSDEEFERNLAILRKGRERVATIQKALMVEGTDYGKIKGIDRPFLHLPGAEILEKAYGLVAEQRNVRIDGQRNDAGMWITPPFGYRSDTIVHLGDLTGPVVAMASGSCNVWEPKYRYRNAPPTCPVCGKTNTIITRKTPPALAGKRQCANFGDKGGCGTVFEPGDPRLAPVGKIDNPDPFDLDETVLQMAAKRSYVAGIRRATGTSGLFTIDEDSPSVRDQSDAAGPDGEGAPAPIIETVGVPIPAPVRGGAITQVQLDHLGRVAKAKGIGGAKIAELLGRLFGLEVAPNGKAASEAVKTLTADQMGALLEAIETGEVPETEPDLDTQGVNYPGIGER